MDRLDAVALQGTQVVGVPELPSQLLEDLPVPVPGRRPVCLLQVLAQMGLHPVIVDKRVVDIEEEDNVRHFSHRPEHAFSLPSMPR